tara:strand:+ start:180 stop:488 length:309 start_codon:yes stop_codon:yes gene_type:complete
MNYGRNKCRKSRSRSPRRCRRQGALQAKDHDEIRPPPLGNKKRVWMFAERGTRSLTRVKTGLERKPEKQVKAGHKFLSPDGSEFLVLKMSVSFSKNAFLGSC